MDIYVMQMKGHHHAYIKKTFNVPSVPSSLHNHKSSLNGKRRTDCAKTNYCSFVLAVVKSTDLLRVGVLF